MCCLWQMDLSISVVFTSKRTMGYYGSSKSKMKEKELKGNIMLACASSCVCNSICASNTLFACARMRLHIHMRMRVPLNCVFFFFGGGCKI